MVRRPSASRAADAGSSGGGGPKIGIGLPGTVLVVAAVTGASGGSPCARAGAFNPTSPAKHRALVTVLNDHLIDLSVSTQRASRSLRNRAVAKLEVHQFARRASAAF